LESATSSSEVTITLRDFFIMIYRNRATIEAMFAVDRADRWPHPAYLDGDFHVAGLGSNIGLPGLWRAGDETWYSGGPTSTDSSWSTRRSLYNQRPSNRTAVSG
jgi:hypothetical protein